MRAKLAPNSMRRIGASTLAIAGAALVSGCFVLFSLDDYGPPAELVDASTGVVDGSRDAGDASVAAKDAGRIVFVTSETFSGNLGGLDGGDTKCQAAAADAGLPGSYRAWLSDQTVSAASRIAPGGPLQLPNGLIVANTAGELASTGPRNRIVLDERNNPVRGGGCDGGLPVWTSTLADGGTYGSLDCQRWLNGNVGQMGIAGIAGGTGTLWTFACLRTCVQMGALYCIEQ